MDLCDKAHKGEISNNLWNANRKEVIFNRFMELVHNHYIEEREVAFYADKLCISPRYLSSVVRSVRIDVTPKAIIDSFVVLEIKALLQSTNLSIQEIADRLHFPDQSFFGRYFKKHTGLMPSRYRAENKWVEK
jgi:YesN/AraC family two-component response regulator